MFATVLADSPVRAAIARSDSCGLLRTSRPAAAHLSVNGNAIVPVETGTMWLLSAEFTAHTPLVSCGPARPQFGSMDM